jgi:serine/threonine protein phosphatase PrpC
VTSVATAARLFLADEESCDLELPTAEVSVRTVRSPDKETANEDAAAIIPIGDGGVVMAVADGVGGSPMGSEASEIAVGMLRDALTADGLEQDRLRSTIMDTVEHANLRLLEMGRRSSTTIVIAEIRDHQLRCYHVGDSELIAAGQRGQVRARIIPHSPTGFAVEAGLLDEDEAVQHEQRHVLFNVIGSPDMRVDVATPIRLADRDTVLIASDGLVDNLFVDEIVEMMRAGPLPAAADRLVAAARRRMVTDGNSKPSKPDDLTIALYRRKRKPSRPRRKSIS